MEHTPENGIPSDESSESPVDSSISSAPIFGSQTHYGSFALPHSARPSRGKIVGNIGFGLPAIVFGFLTLTSVVEAFVFYFGMDTVTFNNIGWCTGLLIFPMNAVCFLCSVSAHLWDDPMARNKSIVFIFLFFPLALFMHVMLIITLSIELNPEMKHAPNFKIDTRIIPIVVLSSVQLALTLLAGGFALANMWEKKDH